jgi:hypothetical protein
MAFVVLPGFAREASMTYMGRKLSLFLLLGWNSVSFASLMMCSIL